MTLYKVDIADIAGEAFVVDMSEAEAEALVARIEALDLKYKDVLDESQLKVTKITPARDAMEIIEDYIASTIREGDEELRRWRE